MLSCNEINVILKFKIISHIIKWKSNFELINARSKEGKKIFRINMWRYIHSWEINAKSKEEKIKNMYFVSVINLVKQGKKQLWIGKAMQGEGISLLMTTCEWIIQTAIENTKNNLQSE